MPYAATSNLGIGLNLGSYVVSRITDNYVAILNGVDQYWQLSEDITTQIGDMVELSFIGGTVSMPYARFFASANNAMSVDAGANSDTFRLSGGITSLNGVVISNGEPIPTSGSHTLSTTVSGSNDMKTLGSLGESRYINLALYNFKLIRAGETIIEIPLTNKSQGATQLPTIGSVSATLVNYNESVWTKE